MPTVPPHTAIHLGEVGVRSAVGAPSRATPRPRGTLRKGETASPSVWSMAATPPAPPCRPEPRCTLGEPGKPSTVGSESGGEAHAPGRPDARPVRGAFRSPVPPEERQLSSPAPPGSDRLPGPGDPAGAERVHVPAPAESSRMSPQTPDHREAPGMRPWPQPPRRPRGDGPDGPADGRAPPWHRACAPRHATPPGAPPPHPRLGTASHARGRSTPSPRPAPPPSPRPPPPSTVACRPHRAGHFPPDAGPVPDRSEPVHDSPSPSSPPGTALMPRNSFTRTSISAIISGLSFRNILAFSRPWPMRWSP